MNAFDKKIFDLLTAYTLNVASDVLNEETVNYQDVLTGEVMPALKKLFNYLDLEPLDIRKERFRIKCLERLGDYTEQEITSFYNYWIQMGERDRLMKFEKEKTWMLSGRLSTWRKIGKSRSIQNRITKGINVNKEKNIPSIGYKR